MKINTIKTKTNEFKAEDVVSVYSGKPNMCMCGCSGKYHYSSVNRDYASKDRGYVITDDEINDSMIKKVMAIFEIWSKDGKTIDNIDDYIFTIDYSCTRQYTIYIKK